MKQPSCIHFVVGPTHRWGRKTACGDEVSPKQEWAGVDDPNGDKVSCRRCKETAAYKTAHRKKYGDGLAKVAQTATAPNHRE